MITIIKNCETFKESGRAGNDDNIGYSKVFRTDKLIIDHDFHEYMHAPCKRQALAKYFGETIDICEKWCDKCITQVGACNKENDKTLNQSEVERLLLILNKPVFPFI